MEKFFLLSRGLWAGIIPLIIATLSLQGVNTDNLAQELETLGTSLILVIGSILGLWSRFRPDGKKLNVKLRKSGPLVLLLAVLLTTGCKTIIDPDTVQIGYGTNEAYSVTGPNVTITAEGEIVCTSPAPSLQPCRAQYAGGWEAWENIVKAIGLPFEAALQLVGRTLSPGK